MTLRYQTADEFNGWFFADYDASTMTPSMLRYDLEYSAESLRQIGEVPVFEPALLALTDDDLCAVARYWSSDEPDEDDRRRF